MQHRCTLDKFQARDTESLVRLLVDPAVRAYLGGPVEASIALQRVQAQLQNNSDLPAWAIRPVAAGPNQLVGVVSLDAHHDGADVEVSYALLPEYQGLGYAAGALQLALRHAFQAMRLPRVIAETQAANTRSVLLLARVGMSPLRTVTRFGALQGIYVMHNPLPQEPRPNHSIEGTNNGGPGSGFLSKPVPPSFAPHVKR